MTVVEDEPKPDKCPVCGEDKELFYGPDPYAQELYDDETPVWQCSDCAHESAMDI